MFLLSVSPDSLKCVGSDTACVARLRTPRGKSDLCVLARVRHQYQVALEQPQTGWFSRVPYVSLFGGLKHSLVGGDV